MRPGDNITSPLRTPSQELLLKAALLPGADALEAWQRWQSITDLDDAPPGSYRLLPLIQRNLEPLGADYPDSGRLKGTRRRTWVQNQLLFRAAAHILRSFRAAGVETMLLRGAALVAANYHDPGVRPMRNTDILVPFGQAQQAARLLRDGGWREINLALSSLTPGFGRLHSSIAFRSPEDVEVRLHWHVLSCCRSAKVDQWFWSAATPAEFYGAETRILNASDQLLYSCLASLQWRYEPPFWRVADAMAILNADEMINGTINADRFVSLASAQRLQFPLYRALDDLRVAFGAPIPEALLGSLAATPVTSNDRHEFEYLTQPYRARSLRAWLTGTYRQHSRSGKGTVAGHLWRSLRWGVVPHLARGWHT